METFLILGMIALSINLLVLLIAMIRYVRSNH